MPGGIGSPRIGGSPPEGISRRGFTLPSARRLREPGSSVVPRRDRFIIRHRYWGAVAANQRIEVEPGDRAAFSPSFHEARFPDMDFRRTRMRRMHRYSEIASVEPMRRPADVVWPGRGPFRLTVLDRLRLRRVRDQPNVAAVPQPER